MNSYSRISKTPLLTGDSVDNKRHEIKTYFLQTSQLYESLFAPILSDQAFYLRPEPLRHPLIFYFGHTAVFFINKLILGKYLESRLDPLLESQCAIGVDEMSWDDLNDGHYQWPSVERVRSYRQKMRDVVSNFIDNMNLTVPICKQDPAWIVLMGIEHERIHLETSSVIIRMLPLGQVRHHPMWEPCQITGSAPVNRLVEISGKQVQLGKGKQDTTYGWDNEYGVLDIQVKPFQASRHLVSNQEYLEFVQANGYEDLQYWSDEGKHWLAFVKAKHPRFWFVKQTQFWQRNLLSEMPLPMNWPVEVNYLEAKAFCNWKSAQTHQSIRLPTESEWYCLRQSIGVDQPNWQEAPGNINLEFFASPCPIDQFESDGLFDVIGNVWQWTETPIDGLPGFQAHPLYDDFSTPTFDGKHHLIKGGSWISTGNEALKSARYAFRRHFFQHAGFRYVEAQPLEQDSQPMNIYETDQAVAQYIEFHYGDGYFDIDNYPHACIHALEPHIKNLPRHRALDLGCSVGRSTFELARYFDQVDGIDFSARFIQAACTLQERNQLRYTLPMEGELVEFKEASLEALGLSALSKKVSFIQGDACNLKEMFGEYDLIFAGNLIDRLYDPALFLDKITQRLNSGGLLVITSPYTWLAEFTEKEKWLGGIKVNGENYSTFDGLKEKLAPNFSLLDTKDIPFVIRETKRKYQHSIAQMSVWKKRP